MKKFLSAMILSFILGTNVSMAVSVDTNQSFPVTDILQRLDQAGYQQIHDITYKDGKYIINAYGNQGQKVKLEVNAKNGSILSPKDDKKSYLTMLQVARKLQQVGYLRIDEIEFDDNYYEVKAYNVNNELVKLNVNSVTGEITKD